MKKIVLSAAVILGLSTAAFAQAATDFATVDADASGGVSWAEASAAWPTLTEDAFKTADADASGELSAEEYAAVAVAPAP
jgi:Skp family chaperone for outer membrane proteins